MMQHCWTYRASPARRSKWLDLCRFDNGVDPEPHLVVADLEHASLQLFTEEGLFERDLVPPMAPWQPCAVAQGGDNTLGVCDWTRNALCLIYLDYVPDYDHSELLGTAHITRPYSVAMTTVGNWAVADETSLVLLDPFGGLIRRIVPPQKAKWSPRHVATDRNQRVFASDPIAGQVYVFDAAGRYLRQLTGAPLRYPCGLMVNDLDQILVCDQGRACVSLFDTHGQYLYDVISRDSSLPNIQDSQIDRHLWRPVSLTSTTAGQVCMTAAYGSEFVLQCFAYDFMPCSARSSHN